MHGLTFLPGKKFHKSVTSKSRKFPQALKYQLGNVSNTVIHRVIS